MRRRLIGMLTSLFLAATVTPAYAAWTADGNASGNVTAETMPSGSEPSGTQDGTSVNLSWTAVSLGSATATGYTVARYEAEELTPVAVSGTCSGVVASTSCTDTGVPEGDWEYTITPQLHNWIGTPGPRGGVTIAASALSFDNSTISSLPETLTGTLSTFGEGESVTFRLDHPATGEVLEGTLDGESTATETFPADGEADVTVVIPAGTTDGSHTVHAVGSGGSSASAAISVDTTTEDPGPGGPDTTAPVVTAGAPNPGTITTTSGTTSITWSATDANLTLGTYQVRVGGTDCTTGTALANGGGNVNVAGAYPTSGAGITSTITSGSLPATSNTVRICVTDSASNVGSDSKTVADTTPKVTAVTTTNVSGGTAGRLDKGDTFKVTFSEAMDLRTFCSGWTETTRTLGGNNAPRVTITNNGTSGGHDALAITVPSADSGDCPAGFKFGAVDLGSADYVTSNVTFGNNGLGNDTKISWNDTTHTLTIQLGTPSSASVSTVAASAITYSPHVDLRDTSSPATGFGSGYRFQTGSIKHF